MLTGPTLLAVGVSIGSLVSCASDNEPSDEASSVDGASWRAVEVIDGDTLDVERAGGELTVRIIGVNTPETGECLSDEATAALDRLVRGDELVLVADRSDVDQFGRALRYVETADGVDVGAALVEQGLAIARRYEPDVARHDRYAALQAAAQDAGRGLWAPDACGTPTEGVSIEIEVNADAPGDDGENLNGEWVTFTNTGERSVDLEGWQVADESASHRYTFDDAELAAGDSITLFSGCGADAGDAVYWCNDGSAVWNNSGDTVFLRDGNGNNVVVLTYGG